MEEKEIAMVAYERAQKEARHLGDLLRILRTKRGLSQNEIRSGLCGKSFMSDIETGNKIPEKILFEALIERMGYSCDKFGLVISSNEYELRILRGLIEESMTESNWEQVAKYLTEYNNLYENSGVLHKQYQLMVEAVLAAEKDHNVKNAIALLQEVLTVVYPNFKIEKLDEYALSGAEIRSIIGIMELNIRLGKVYSIHEIEKVENFINTKIMDNDLLTKSYTQFSYVAAKSGIANKEWETVKKVTDKGIDFLIEEGGIALLYELLTYNIQALNNLGEKDLELERIDEKNALFYTYNYFEITMKDDLSNLLFPICKEDIILNNELIHKERMARGITPQALETEGINTSSLCKIERGKRKPRSITYYNIMQIMGENRAQYDGWVEVNDYEVYLKIKETVRLINRSDHEQLDELISQLETELDMDEVKNRQYIGGNRLEIAVMKGKMTSDKALEEAYELLNLSKKKIAKETVYGATRVEIMLITIIAANYERSGKISKAIAIYKIMIAAFEDSKLNKRSLMLKLTPVYSNLSNLYEMHGLEADAITTAKKGVQLLVSCKSGNLLGRYMATIGMAENRISDKEKSENKNLFIQSYYLNKLMNHQENCGIISKYIEKEYNVLIM